jgi:hypothetical protein
METPALAAGYGIKSNVHDCEGEVISCARHAA